MLPELRPYQIDALNALWAFWRSGSRGVPLIVAPTGSGKALLAAKMVEKVVSSRPQYRVMVVTHRKEIIEQNAKELQKFLPTEPLGIYSASLRLKQFRRVTFANIQSIYKKDIPETHLVIIDECFTGETKIKLISREKRIDQVRLGDVVYNAIGPGKVIGISKRKISTLYKIRLSDGRKIKCTGNHPFFTRAGWKQAKELDQGEILISFEDMPMLWSGVQALEKQTPRSKRKVMGRPKILFDILLEEVRERYVGFWSKRKNASDLEANRSQAIATWWKRQWAYQCSKNDQRDSRGRMGNGNSNSNKNSQREWLSYLLQNRPRASNEKNRDRTRRKLSCRQKADLGSEKGQSFNFARVESVEIQEFRNGKLVYNLEIDGHPSYFAEGCLVHNCHLIPNSSESMYQKFLASVFKKNPQAKIVGLTATPYRLDQGSLIGPGNLFTDIAYNIDIKALIEKGFLSPIKSKVNAERIDFSEVRKTGYDYNQGELQSIFSPLTERHCKEIIEKAGSRSKWLIFCSGIAHAKEIASAMSAMGIAADFVSGELLHMERDRRIRDFNAGKLKVLANCDVLTTGFNSPAIDLLVLLRATKSAALYVQMVGRGMRTAPGKADCLVLDFGGNIERHGPIDMIEVKQKSGDKKASVTCAPFKICENCGASSPAGTAICPDCEHAFPARKTALELVASKENILSEDSPYKWRKVLSTTFRVHRKEGKPPSLRIIYDLGRIEVSEFLCFEHGGFASAKARTRWIQLGGNIKMRTAEEAFLAARGLKEVDSILIDKDGSFYRVKGERFRETPKKEALSEFEQRIEDANF